MDLLSAHALERKPFGFYNRTDTDPLYVYGLTSLPLQMVWVHEPLRLIFIVESRPTLVSSIVQRHKNLQHLVDNRWLLLIVLDIQTSQFTRYDPGGNWSAIPSQPPAAMVG